MTDDPKHQEVCHVSAGEYAEPFAGPMCNDYPGIPNPDCLTNLARAYLSIRAESEQLRSITIKANELLCAALDPGERVVHNLLLNVAEIIRDREYTEAENERLEKAMGDLVHVDQALDAELKLAEKLDAAKAEIKRLKQELETRVLIHKGLAESHSKTQADRDRWKARAKKAESRSSGLEYWVREFGHRADCWPDRPFKECRMEIQKLVAEALGESQEET
ncbi:MAG: hypothetical protein GY926_19565 [bacterium]|nr:hypothetical protein [bacterium]